MASQGITTTETIPVEPTYHMRLPGSGTNPTANRPKVSTLRLKTLKLDPARALEPARKKLTTIESQRIMAVFEDAIKRAEIVTAFPYIVENLDRFRVSFGSELVDLFKMHSRTQGSYRQIRTTLDDLLKKRAAIIAEQERLAILAKEEEERQRLAEQQAAELDLDNEESKLMSEIELPETEAESTVREESSEHSKTKSPAPSDEGSGKRSVADNVEQMTAEPSPMTGPDLSEIDPRIEECMRNLGLVAQQVSHSCKNILRLFSTNPAAAKLILSESGVRDERGQKIIDSMEELKEILMHKLLTTPEEEMERMAYLDDISKRERHNAAIIEKQEQELKAALDDKEEEIRKKNEIIRRLQTDLHQIEKFSEENIRRTRAEAEKQEIADSKNSDQKTQKLQAEINQLQAQLNSAITEHREVEAELRAKKYKVENEVDNWIQKYDQDLGERQDEYEEIDLIYTEEKKQLFELEERFATLEKEYLAIMEERRVSREKRERAQRELAILVRSATTIQAFWRSYKVRKALKAKNKKKGGKKKG